MDSQFAKDAEEISGNPSVSPLKTAVKYGIYMTLSFIVLNLIMYIAGLPLDSPIQYIQYIFFIIFIYLGLKEYRDQELGGFMSYGKGVSCGLLISVIAAILFAIYFFIFIKFINPEFVDMIKAAQEKALLDRGTDQATVDKQMEMASMWMKPGVMIAFSILGTTITGLIFSLIISAVVKKVRPMFGA